jgi:hypothetical protein
MYFSPLGRGRNYHFQPIKRQNDQLGLRKIKADLIRNSLKKYPISIGSI